MIFSETELAGVFVLDPERHHDARGHFARTFCVEEYRARGLDARVAQMSTSYNAKRHTLRGLHYQAAPDGEAKTVRCVRGAIHDVVVDLRPTSPSFRRWLGIELSADNGRAVYLPEGIAHGFLTLTDGAEVSYVMSTPHAPGAARGLRWDDPALGIRWPARPAVLSERDAAYPDLGS
jgi:dTDP-4-dehydrorhamnose 3,5-epimerase